MEHGDALTTHIITGDCRTALAAHGPFDMLLADPPYGDTSLNWDRQVAGWIGAAYAMLKPNGSMWVFGSLRFLLGSGPLFDATGWKLAQDIVWEKQNGTGFHKDRFKRVHEHAVQFYRTTDKWADVFNEVQRTMDATPRVVRRKKHPNHHLGERNPSVYVSEDGGPRLMRSVIQMRNCHGRAIHPTEKPDALLEILIRTSCPIGGLVGDLFAGSGACGEAAMRAGRRYVGIEIDPAMAAKARDRLGALLPMAAA